MRKSLLVLFILGVAMAILGGCSNTTDPTGDDASLEDFGAYKATDEDPYFGDADLAAIAEGEEEVNDEILLSPVADSIIDSTEAEAVPDIFCFRVVWGNLENDSGVTDLTDWSGKLTVSRGAIVATHKILFEPGQDYLLPRYNDSGVVIPEELGWVSLTSYHHDGLGMKLFFPPSVTDEVVTITYESPQLTISFTMDQLEDLDTLISIGFGNAISFQAVRFDPSDRTRGSLAGRWGRDAEGNGIFYGIWYSAAGQVMGALKGEWGIDENGRQVFVGKWIDDTGQFEGFVKGFYANRGNLSPVNARIGRFWGLVYDVDRTPIGSLKGHYWRGDHKRAGLFAGRWCVGCNIPTVTPLETF